MSFVSLEKSRSAEPEKFIPLSTKGLKAEMADPFLIREEFGFQHFVLCFLFKGMETKKMQLNVTGRLKLSD